MVFNSTSMIRLARVLTGAFIVGGALVCSIGAWYLLRGRHAEFARRSLLRVARRAGRDHAIQGGRPRGLWAAPEERPVRHRGRAGSVPAGGPAAAGGPVPFLSADGRRR